MRIQHNILAMNSYRNYNNNTAALGKNLERLSSGYKINRAGDDAAGLAISEKMRAQITGLEAAQKNVKDGVSLVKTAEGAMQEVQDMLNRMVYLATQSANGTYDSETDRANLQKEVDALKTEIDRIADSANFNGIKLLDGSQVGTLAQSAYTEVLTSKTVKGIDRILSADIGTEQPWEVAGKKNVYDVYSQSAAKASFKVDLSKLDVSFKVDPKKIESLVKAGSDVTLSAGSVAANMKITIKIGADLSIDLNASQIGSAITVKISASGTVTASLNAAKLASAVITRMGSAGASKAIVTLNGVAWKMTASGADGKLSFEQLTAPTEADKCNANFDVNIEFEAGAAGSYGEIGLTGNLNFGTEAEKPGVMKGAGHGAATTFSMTTKDIVDGAVIKIGNREVTLAVGAKSKNNTGTYVDLMDMDPNKVDLKIALTKICAKLNEQSITYDGKNVKGNSQTATFKAAVADGGISVLRTDEMNTSDNVMFQTRAKLAEIFSLKTPDGTLDHEAVDASGGLVLQIGDTSENFNQMRVIIGDMHTTGMGISDVNISTQQSAQDAVSVIKDAINYVSGIRGDLGAVQNRLEHTQNNLSVMAENIQDAESTIRDTDVAEEMMSYVKNNILVQSAQAMLAQANQVPQGVLQLLG